MKLIIALVVAFMLSGCMYQTVNKADIDAANFICGSPAQVAEITSNFMGGERVTCLDRDTHMINEDSIHRKIKEIQMEINK